MSVRGMPQKLKTAYTIMMSGNALQSATIFWRLADELTVSDMISSGRQMGRQSVQF